MPVVGIVRVRDVHEGIDLAVDADLLFCRIDFGAHFRDDLPIDFHTAIQNQLFTFSAAADSTFGKGFLGGNASKSGPALQIRMSMALLK